MEHSFDKPVATDVVKEFTDFSQISNVHYRVHKTAPLIHALS
jgi:hypothetical protein